MVQYLAKFVDSHGAAETVRMQEHQWCWLPAHDQAISKLKQMLCEAPVLRYFDPSKPITLRVMHQKVVLAIFCYKSINHLPMEHMA